MKLQKCLKKLPVLRVWRPRVGSYGGASVDGLDDASEGGPLCARCSGIVLPDEGQSWSFQLGPIHEILSRAHYGCRFCKLVAIGLDLERLKPTCAAREHYIRLSTSTPDSFLLTGTLIHDQTPVPDRSMDFIVVRPPTRTAENGSLNTPQASDRIEDIPCEPDSDAAFDFLTGCINSCIEDHYCGGTSNVVLPTRVLDVSEKLGDKVRLYVSPSESKKARYVALSYCWGSSQAFITTSRTLADRIRGFPLGKLPKTIRDVVHLTRKLGCQYLWVDALCILQGPGRKAREDWKRESAHMEYIYCNAFVTIAAAASSHCNGGLFYARSCWLPFTGPGDDISTQRLAKVVRPRGRREFRDEPINSRAWTLQERLLSRRIVTYTLDEIMFQCDHGMKWDPSPSESPHRIYRYHFPAWSEVPRWRFIVENYCSRDLSNPEDKLPAIAGLARHFHQLTRGSEGRYLAGLWEKSLITEIMWARHSIFKIFYANPCTSMSNIYRAPSWSWAANDGIVSHMTVHAVDARKKWRRLSKIVSCTTTLATPDPFGMVTSGELVIRGPCKAVGGIRDGWKLYDVTHDGCKTVDVAEAVLDFEYESDLRNLCNVRSIYCLRIFKDIPGWAGLVLVDSGNGKSRTRIGIFTTQTEEQEDYWEHVLEETVVII